MRSAAAVLIALALLPAPAPAATAEDHARCAALWYGMVDAGRRLPGLLRDTSDALALAQTFEAAAGPDAAPVIAEERPGMTLLVRAYLGGDEQSIRLFDRLATRCDEIASG